MKMSKSNDKMIHDKAIRLLEGGVVEVDGLFVSMVRVDDDIDPCYLCEMDCLCHIGTEINEVCNEGDSISDSYFYLELVNKN